MSVVVCVATTVVIQQCDQSVPITDWLTALAALLSSAASFWVAMTSVSKKTKVKKKAKKKSR
ncbi:hypothetical protein [Lacticaseibacillus jixiensis]|uniref:hypothetical protein n=1 Tax=Lacticaseibacillus jixiensis TaxID=3231926 RepID=UPI0036F1D2C4